MTLTVETIANYLGKDSDTILSDVPFKNWKYKKTIENGLKQPQFDYVFTDARMDFVSDFQDKISSIFLYYDESRTFCVDVKDLILNRNGIIELFGSPSKCGDGLDDPVLGVYGAWNRFSRSGYAIHVEYRVNSNTVDKITLMRADVVPQ